MALRRPLGVAARQVTHPVPGQISVLPPFRSRRHLPSRLARLREMDGRSAVQTRGGGTEFDSLREYTDDDEFRRIDWAATARAHKPIVRTYRAEPATIRRVENDLLTRLISRLIGPPRRSRSGSGAV